METLKLVFYILGSAAFLGLIIFFITLIFNKDDGVDLEQGRINYLSREVDRLDKKISKEAEEKSKKCPWDFEDIAKKMSFKLSDLKPTEKDVALAFQTQQFEEKEKKYVEKIRQLEKILADEEIKVSACGQVANLKADSLKNIINDTEKKRTEAYDLIANVYEFEQTIMPEYGRYNAGAIDISELGKELESTFREYFRREKKIKEKSK